MKLKYFKKLSNQERKEYVANILKQNNEYGVIKRLARNSNMVDLNLESISGCFEWQSTPQGRVYWKTIEQRITGGVSLDF